VSTGAIICDTGALLDYLVEGAPDHERFRNAMDRARTRYVPALVLAEVDYFLRRERRAMAALMSELKRGAFTFAPAALPLLERAMDIDKAYPKIHLGLVDASIVALAERVGVTRIATRDVKHFAVVRLRDGSPFELAVVPSDPDD
jgi:predicted nucleic acid-binding protein